MIQTKLKKIAHKRAASDIEFREIEGQHEVGHTSSNESQSVLDNTYLLSFFMAAATLYALHLGTPHAGWGFLLSLVLYGYSIKQAVPSFLFGVLSLVGLYFKIDYSGWLMFFAFVF